MAGSAVATGLLAFNHRHLEVRVSDDGVSKHYDSDAESFVSADEFMSICSSDDEWPSPRASESEDRVPSSTYFSTYRPAPSPAERGISNTLPSEVPALTVPCLKLPSMIPVDVIPAYNIIRPGTGFKHSADVLPAYDGTNNANAAKPQSNQAQDSPPPSITEESTAARIAKLLTKDNMCKAARLLLHTARTGGSSLAQVAAEVEAVGGNPDDVAQALAYAETIVKCTEECDDPTGWQQCSDGDLKVYHRHDRHSTIYSFKFVTTLDAPLVQPLALAREFDLVSSWMKYIEDSLVLEERTVSEIMTYCALWLPWPLGGTDLLMHCRGTELLDDLGCVLLSFQCRHDLRKSFTLPAAAAKRANLQVMEGSCMRFKPLPPVHPGGVQRTFVSSVCHVDAGTKFVPSLIIKFVLHVLAPMLHQQVVLLLKKNFKDDSAALPTRLRNRPALYGVLSRAVDAYLAQHGAELAAEEAAAGAGGGRRSSRTSWGGASGASSPSAASLGGAMAKITGLEHGRSCPEPGQGEQHGQHANHPGGGKGGAHHNGLLRWPGSH